MAIYTRSSGTHFTVQAARLFREETRRWYVRLMKATAGGDLSVKVYDSLDNATNGTADFTASATVAAFAGTLIVPLADNVAVAPTFTDATVTVAADAASSTGTEIWSVDLGPKLERAVLRIVRALSAIKLSGGYSTEPIVERAMRQWEEIAIFPWIGVVGVSMASIETQEIGSGPWGAGLDTEYIVRLLAHDVNAGDTTALFLFHDVRRAIAALVVPYDGAVNDGIPFSGVRFQAVENDLSVAWARERSTIEINLVLVLQESNSEITSG